MGAGSANSDIGNRCVRAAGVPEHSAENGGLRRYDKPGGSASAWTVLAVEVRRASRRFAFNRYAQHGHGSGKDYSAESRVGARALRRGGRAGKSGSRVL